jgi:MipA family protein
MSPGEKPRGSSSFRAMIAGAMAMYCIAADSDELPLWEAGFGVAPISFPEYRGSRSQRQYLMPLPYLIYRGEILEVDRGGIRGLLVDAERFEMDLSFNGAVPVKSSDDGPRSGMPDLDPVVEVGVSLGWLLGQGTMGRTRLRLPVRAVFATDLASASHVGWKAEPQLHAETHEIPGRWNLSVATGPIFADRGYHGYYFDVDPEFAIPGRPAYRAGSGYSGWSVTASASRRVGSIWVGAFLRYDNLEGASFADSPLVETSHAAMAGIGAAYIFRQSSRPAASRW